MFCTCNVVLKPFHLILRLINISRSAETKVSFVFVSERGSLSWPLSLLLYSYIGHCYGYRWSAVSSVEIVANALALTVQRGTMMPRCLHGMDVMWRVDTFCGSEVDLGSSLILVLCYGRY